MKVELKQNMRIVFQGDSITDCGRREPAHAPYGRGFVSIIASWLLARFPEMNLNILNRGVSADRTKNLISRWSNDCVGLKPDLVSILIGINNVAFRYNGNDPTPVDDFDKQYETILKRTRDETDAVLVICEPFLLACPEGIEVWREDLDPKIQVIRELARRFSALYVPLDGIFSAASTRVYPSFWAEDGVHPTPQGHGLIAQAWMETVLGVVP